MLLNRIRPTTIRLETSSVCQLACPSCPVHGGVTCSVVGNGFLKLSDFKELVDGNPRIREIELSNYGEIFLNPDLLGMLEYAHERGVALKADGGVNMNRVSDEVLEGLVRYRLRSMTCSIDGASDETYRLYRVGGDLRSVLANIRRLNTLKDEYRSEYPKLRWQFVVFGHNEHEISRARELARSLDMAFHLKLSWDPDLSPVKDKETLRRELGAADRAEYRQRFGADYVRGTCYELWNSPQINWDGKVLGCCRNFWGDFGSSVFRDGLAAGVNSPRIRYARRMLLGKKPPQDGIPCSTCSLYTDMRARGTWLKRSDISAERRRAAGRIWNPSPRVRRSLPYRVARFVYRSVRPASVPRLRLNSLVHPLEVPLPSDGVKGWKPYGIFNGSTRGLKTLSCHVSVLARDVSPHPPHSHRDEEVLMLLSGEVDLVVPDMGASGQGERVCLRPGEFVYYPSDYAHTLQTTSSSPANYLMFRWSAGVRRTDPVLGYGLFDPFEHGSTDESADGFSPQLVFEGPTRFLRKLHCHATTLSAGRGYDSHVDEHDVVIVVLEGEVETLGRRVLPHGVVFYAAGEPHAMHNPGRTAAKYVVFEFHYPEKRLGAWLRAIRTRVKALS